MKKVLFVLCLFAATGNIFAVGSNNQKRFVKGTVADKTEAVRSASDKEILDLAKAAIEFSVNYKDLLGEDPELAELVISGIECLPYEYLENASTAEKTSIANRLLTVYGLFSEAKVRSVVLEKFTNSPLPVENIVTQLNVYVKSVDPEAAEPELIKQVVSTLEKIGNSDSFEILFRVRSESRWEPFYAEIENAIAILAKQSEQKILELISAGNVKDCMQMLNLIAKNSQTEQILSAQIAENVLSRTIYIYENTTKLSEDLIPLQIDSFNLLAKNNWTRASATAVRYLKNAETEYTQKVLPENEYCKIIVSVIKIAPIGAIQPLSSMLVALNRQKEANQQEPSEAVMLSIINSLGEAGDKNAFDALLSVTYFEYPDSVVAAARNALAKLKW
ncbi:MAG: hypothetical protein II098_03925 [Treponema sp.]|nr:hypothetical protein [Treponema sp.]